MIEKLLMKLGKRFRVSEAEAELLRSAQGGVTEYERDQMLVPQEKKLGYSSLLLEGFTARSTVLPDGDRQIMELNVPGDFIDLHSYPLEWLDHDIVAMTRCKLVKYPHDNISRIIQEDPRLGRIFWFATMIDAAINRQWVVTLGRRDAGARVAHLFCELFYRLRVVGLVDDQGGYEFPLRQADIANALGMTPVHVNRKLRDLREQGLCTFREGRVFIDDLKALERAAEFDPQYLFLQPRTI